MSCNYILYKFLLLILLIMLLLIYCPNKMPKYANEFENVSLVSLKYIKK